TSSTSRRPSVVGGPSAVLRLARAMSALMALTRARTAASVARAHSASTAPATCARVSGGRGRTQSVSRSVGFLTHPRGSWGGWGGGGVGGGGVGKGGARALEPLELSVALGLQDLLLDPGVPALPGRLALAHRVSHRVCRGPAGGARARRAPIEAVPACPDGS